MCVCVCVCVYVWGGGVLGLHMHLLCVYFSYYSSLFFKKQILSDLLNTR